MHADSNDDAAAVLGPLRSLRPYRSRKTRPCDRCRSRKQRCVVLSDTPKCLHCNLSNSECKYTDASGATLPPPTPTSNTSSLPLPPVGAGPSSISDGSSSNSSTSSNSVQLSSSAPSSWTFSNSNNGDATATTTGPSQPNISPSMLSAPLCRIISVHSIYSPSVLIFSICTLAVLILANGSSTINPNISPPNQISPPLAGQLTPASSTTSPLFTTSTLPLISPSENYMSLDAEAGNDDGLYFVGTASERDALVLAQLTGNKGSLTQGYMSPSTSTPGLKVRFVSKDPQNPAAFVYYKGSPYLEQIALPNPVESLASLVGNAAIEQALMSFQIYDCQAFPIWAVEHSATVAGGTLALQSCCIATGLIYGPHKRFMHQAWSLVLGQLRKHMSHARLSTVQTALLDLHGRAAIDPAGNYVRLGTVVAIANLLGLHCDCSQWTIPVWERQLRNRLWWALVQYDRMSGLIFGRTPFLGPENYEVPFPDPSFSPSTSYKCFLAMCHLSILMDVINRKIVLPAQNETSAFIGSSNSGKRHNEMARQRKIRSLIRSLSNDLDKWRRDAEAQLQNYNPSNTSNVAIQEPGVCSLKLLDLYCGLVLAREDWNCALAVLEVNESAEVVRRCLDACAEIAQFTENLRPEDVNGYWSPHSPFILSTCLTLLVRIALQADKTDQSPDAIWQIALYQTRRLIGSLAQICKNQSQLYPSTTSTHLNLDWEWDIANLCLARARYFIPMLSCQAAEFSVALEPLQQAMPEPPKDSELEIFLNSILDERAFDTLFVTSS